MSINTFRPGLGGALPTTHETPGGLASGTRTPHAGPGVGQHAALVARAPRWEGASASAPLRVALGILSQNVGHRLEGTTSKTHLLNQVASGNVNLRGTYSPAQLERAAGVAVKGWAELAKQSGLV